MLHLRTGNQEKLQQTLDRMEASGVNYKQVRHLQRFMSFALGNKNYDAVVFFALKWVEIAPDDPQAFIQVALAYAYGGNRAKAIEYANKVKEFGGDYIGEADAFIQNVNSGYFEQNQPQ